MALRVQDEAGNWIEFLTDEELREKKMNRTQYQQQQEQRPLPGRHGGGFYQQRWAALVADKRQRGVPVAQAVNQVMKENPGLREDMLREANGR